MMPMKQQSEWLLLGILVLLQSASCDQSEMFDQPVECFTDDNRNCEQTSEFLWTSENAADANQIEFNDRVIGPPCNRDQRLQTVTVIHVSDLHAHYARAEDGNSPYARLAGYAQKTRTQNPYTLFTDGGDDYEKGSVAELQSDGYATMRVTQAMGFDVRVLGNHDFAWSAEHTAAYSRDPKSIVLSSNIKFAGDDPESWGAVDYEELQLGCVRIGVFGLTTRPWNERDREFTGDYYPDFYSRYDFEKVAEQIVSEHRAEVDLLIMINHIGYYYDLEIAKNVSGIDLIFGGHSHTDLEKPDDVDGTLVVHAGSHARFAMRLDLAFDRATRSIASYTHQRVNVTASDMPDVDRFVAQTIDEVMTQYAPRANQAIGYTEAWSSNSEAIARVAARAAKTVLNADAAIIDKRTVWSEWEANGLTQQMLLDAFKIQHHPPGSPGTTAFFNCELEGRELEDFRKHLSTDWQTEFPETIKPNERYKVVLQKLVALHPEDHFGDPPRFTNVTFASEAWKVLDAYARQRTEQCRFVDTEAWLPDCLRAPLSKYMVGAISRFEFEASSPF